MELKGSITEQNLKTAFAGESQARNKYSYYASKAKKEGLVSVKRNPTLFGFLNFDKSYQIGEEGPSRVGLYS